MMRPKLLISDLLLGVLFTLVEPLADKKNCAALAPAFNLDIPLLLPAYGASADIDQFVTRRV
jgi:hypothetical protein